MNGLPRVFGSSRLFLPWVVCDPRPLLRGLLRHCGSRALRTGCSLVDDCPGGLEGNIN